MSTTGVITATGTKGLLQYLKTYRPELYRAANQPLLAYAKKTNAAANETAGMMGTLRAIYRGTPYAQRSGGMEGLGDYYTNYVVDAPLSSSNPPIDLTGAINATPIDVGDISATLPPAADLTVTPSSSANDSASVASSGATSSGFANIISSIAKGIGTATLTAAQVSANNTLLQTNLLRAQQGLPPLTATTAGGFTTLGSSSSLLLLGGALLIGLVAMGSKK
jgi:hypothetical protein